MATAEVPHDAEECQGANSMSPHAAASALQTVKQPCYALARVYLTNLTQRK